MIGTEGANNEENFKRYQKRLAELQAEGGLVPPPDLPDDKLISFLAAEGEKLLGITPEKQSPKIVKTESNPYLQARNTILEKMTPTKRKELAEMEKNGKIDNKTYSAFIAEVTKLGDALAEKKRKKP